MKFARQEETQDTSLGSVCQTDYWSNFCFRQGWGLPLVNTPDRGESPKSRLRRLKQTRNIALSYDVKHYFDILNDLAERLTQTGAKIG